MMSTRSPSDRQGVALRRPPGRGAAPAAGALKELMIEVTLLHWHVAAASRALAEPEDLSNAQVSVLRTIHAEGPQTVPQLAASRAVARQPVQRSVDELADLGLVTLDENPRHKRSRLVTLTDPGLRRLREMERRQSAWTRSLADGLGERSLRTSSRLLRRLRERISARLLLPAPTRGTKP